ncbi:MAG: CBS domain-containing protein [Candidatus Atribacteria bacterium]|nr:CBS domain-containing protein [Candidatus Atribacteria bacterium]
MKNKKIFTLKELTDNLKQIQAKDIMTKDVVTVTKDDTLDEVAELMISKRITGFPVIEDGKIIGIITSDDLFMVMDMIKTGEVLKDNSTDDALPKVSFAMSTEVITVSSKADLDEIITLMKYRNVRTLPVVNKNEMVGIIGRRDVYNNFYCTLKGICPSE